MITNRQLFTLTRGFRLWIGAVVLVGIITVCLSIAQFTLIGTLIEQAYEEEPISWGMLLVLGVILLFHAGLAWLSRIAMHRAAARSQVLLRDRVYTHIQKLGPGFLGRERTGTLITTAVSGIESMQDYVSRYLPQLLLSFLVPLLIVAYIMLLDPFIGLVLLAVQVAIPVVMGVLRRAFGDVSGQFWDLVNTLSAMFLNGLQGLPTLKMFNQGKAYASLLDTQSERLRWIMMDSLFVSLFSLFFIEWATVLGTIVAASSMVAWRLQADLLTFGAGITIVLLSWELTRPLLALRASFDTRPGGVAAARQIIDILETPITITTARNATTPESFEGHIRLENVSFSYTAARESSLTPPPPAPKPRRGWFRRKQEAPAEPPEPEALPNPVLDDVSFTIQSGETVALVGASGAGKSTIVNLLLRFYDPQRGQIFFDEHPITELPLEWLRTQIALVPQDTYLFYGSITENLRIARPYATPEQVEHATRIANIHEDILAMPHGYETLVGERGLALSGGQAQRVAIARAILKDAPILVLDEATSQVDAASERMIQQSLEQLGQHKTIFMIAHRLSTVRNANRILVMEHGRIIEAGTHNELIARQGVYARLTAAQRIAAPDPEPAP